MKYLNNKRIEKALDLLKLEYMSVNSIAEATGFYNINYFYRAFKKIIGCTPTVYRKRYIEKKYRSK